MKGIYLPDTVHRFILPNLSPVAQLLLYKLLYYSGTTYHNNIWPSISTLARSCHLKDIKTVRAGLAQLQKFGLIEITERFGIKNGVRQQLSNQYILNFDWYEAIDKKRGIKMQKKDDEILKAIATVKDSVQKVDHRIDAMTFEVKRMFTEELKPYEKILEYVGKFGKEILFRASEPVSASFVESEFKRHGHKIRILKAS